MHQEVKHLEGDRRGERKNSARRLTAVGQFYLISNFCFLKSVPSLPQPPTVCVWCRPVCVCLCEPIVMVFPHMNSSQGHKPRPVRVCAGGFFFFFWGLLHSLSQHSFPLRNKLFWVICISVSKPFSLPTTRRSDLVHPNALFRSAHSFPNSILLHLWLSHPPP